MILSHPPPQNSHWQGNWGGQCSRSVPLRRPHVLCSAGCSILAVGQEDGSGSRGPTTLRYLEMAGGPPGLFSASYQIPRLWQGQEQPCSTDHIMSSKGQASLLHPWILCLRDVSGLQCITKGLPPRQIYGAACCKIKLGKEEELGVKQFPLNE